METISGNFLTSSLTEEFLINPSYLQNDQVLQQVIFDQIDSFFFWLNQNVSTFWHLFDRKGLNSSYLQNDQVLQKVIFDQIDSYFFQLNQNVSTDWHWIIHILDVKLFH